MLVGFAVDRRGGQAYFQPLAAWTGNFITAGTRLDTDIEYQCLVVPAIQGLGIFRRGSSLCQLLKWG